MTPRTMRPATTSPGEATPALNRLLEALSPRDRAALAPHMQHVTLEVGQLLARRGENFRDAWFPENSMISQVTRMADGRSVEVGTVGNEGVAGLVALLDADVSDTDTFCQISGDAVRIPMPVLLDAYHRRASVRRQVNRYAQAYIAHVGQNAACNRLHGIEQRCARWLLMVQDRALSPAFHLKQQFLSEMLGVSRVSVTQAALSLQDDGMIHYRRGIVRVTNRDALLAAACECYGIVRERFDRALS